MSKKVLYPIIVLLIGLLLAVLLASNKPDIEGIERTPLVTTIRVTQVAAQSEYLTVTSQGSVQPRSESSLIPEVSGRVVWISPSLVGGGSFSAGDVLLRIDEADYQSTLARNQAVLVRAEVEQQFADDELTRLQSLYKKKLTSQSVLDSARRSADVAQANLNEAQALLDQAQRDLSRTQMFAPFDGLVRSEQVDLGQFVSRGNSIGVIYATDYVEVRLPIAASQASFLGLPLSTRGEIPEDIQPLVTLTADFGNTRVIWEGVLVRAEAEIDKRSQMMYGVVRLLSAQNDDTPPIAVGLFVQAEIRGRKVDDVIRLPRSAIRDQNQVLVVDSDNRLHFRSVSVLRLEHDDVLIDDGLIDGELVSVSPMQTVVDGMLVKPVRD
jgi:RND family efflux transporter MFP subunit